ncbi:hypothetical protein AJ88_20125 [Mesorhizobium amorphae CCBAU 01583]|nr:hypothetical protein AJ88_20125 [Mesorhizobium amorphae CCBAU 01583]
MRRRIAVEDVVALLDDVAVLEMKRLALRDQVFDRLKRRVMRLDDDAALVLVVAAEADRAVDLGNDGVVLRTACLEEFGNTRQTAGDVLGLGAFHRDTRQHVAGPDMRARLDRKDRLNREQEAGIAALRQLANLALGVMHDDRRLEVVAAWRRTPVDDLALGDAGRLVGRFLDGNAVDQILELHLALDFGEDRAGIRIPLGDTLAALHLVAIVHEDARTIGDPVRGALLAGFVEDQHRHVAAHDHLLAVGVAHHVAVADLDLALIRGFKERAVHHLRGTAHVEGTHGELGTRLTDRLRRDDADGFALVDRGAAGKITSVADRATPT